jgi:hypothetical protein
VNAVYRDLPSVQRVCILDEAPGAPIRPRLAGDGSWSPGGWRSGARVDGRRLCAEGDAFAWLIVSGCEVWRCEAESSLAVIAPGLPPETECDRFRLLGPLEHEILQRHWTTCRDVRVLLRIAQNAGWGGEIVAACKARVASIGAGDSAAFTAWRESVLYGVPESSGTGTLSASWSCGTGGESTTVHHGLRTFLDDKWRSVIGNRIAAVCKVAREWAMAAVWDAEIAAEQTKLHAHAPGATQGDRAAHVQACARARRLWDVARSDYTSLRPFVLAELADVVRKEIPFCPINRGLEGSAK